MALRVVIAEDTLLVREGVRLVLDRAPDVEVVAEAASLPELRACLSAHEPDVLVTDVRMPPTFTDEGIRVAVELRDTNPEIGVVVLSQYAEPGYAKDLLGGGSARRAYLLKERVSDPRQLLDAVRTVAAGGSVIDPSVVDLLVSSSARTPRSPLGTLSERERQVLEQVAQGRSNAAVGAALALSERAVEKHINTLFTKLGLLATPDVNRRVTAVLMLLSDRSARSRKLAPLPDPPKVIHAAFMPVDVLIVDDQAPFRDAARTLIELLADWQVVGEVETGEAAVDAVADRQPELVLMDINLPGHLRSGGHPPHRRQPSGRSRRAVVDVREGGPAGRRDVLRSDRLHPQGGPHAAFAARSVGGLTTLTPVAARRESLHAREFRCPGSTRRSGRRQVAPSRSLHVHEAVAERGGLGVETFAVVGHGEHEVAVAP